MNSLRRSFNLFKYVLTSQPTFVYTPKRYILHSAKRLKTKPKLQEFEAPRIPQQKFEEEANVLLYRLQKAFEELRHDDSRVSETFVTELNSDPFENPEEYSKVLAVQVEHVGEYNFKINDKEQMFYMSSPSNGICKYFYDEANERWISNRDKHIFEDLLVRDFTKNCKGLLKL